MCTYLDQVGSTYYFRRVVPVELRPFLQTRSGAPRTEWKYSLKTKDRDEAKRLIPHHALATQADLDRAEEARRAGVHENGAEKPIQRVNARASATVAAWEERSEEAAQAISEDVARRDAALGCSDDLII